MNELINSNQIVIPARISKAFVQRHQSYIFVYSIDIQCSSVQGQPSEFVGQHNCYPVPTIERYCPSQKIYFNDAMFVLYANAIDDALDKVAQQAFVTKHPVIPCRKIGMGCSRMNELAPRLFAYLQKRLDILKYPDIKWNYNQ